MSIQTIKQQRYWVILICLAICVGTYGLLVSPATAQNPILYFGIAVDLLITSPAIYWFATKKHTLKKPITIALFVIGIFTFLRFAPNQCANTLKNILSIAVPIIEFGVFGFILYKFRNFIKTIDWSKDDVFLAVNDVTRRTFDNKNVAAIVASEFCMFYYSFFAWRKKSPQENEFTYHKTGSNVILWAIIGLILIESVVIHLLLMKWNAVISYILLALSLYTAIQLFAHIKAKSRRFIQVNKHKLILKNGLSNYFEIPFDQIKSIEKDSLGNTDKDNFVAKFGLLEDLENHNVKLNFHSILSYDKIYGMRGEAKSLLLHVDQESEFIEVLQSKVAP